MVITKTSEKTESDEKLTSKDYNPGTGVFCEVCGREFIISPDMTVEEEREAKRKFRQWCEEHPEVYKTESSPSSIWAKYPIETDNGQWVHEVCDMG